MRIQLSFFNLLFPVVRPKRKRQVISADPLLKRVWLELRATWFADRPDIDQYTVAWSRRGQLRTLASCNPRLRRVNVARELSQPEHYEWLEPLLYHEMCHAVLGNSVKRWHGKEFKALERKHPKIKALNQWIKAGGWRKAVRSDRSRRAYHQNRDANVKKKFH